MLPARAVSPEWEDWPQRAQKTQRLKTPEQNGDMFQAPSPARQRVPGRIIRFGYRSQPVIPAS